MEEHKIARYDTIAECEDNIVVAEYIPEKQTDTAHQSEAEMEKMLIGRLDGMGYTYALIRDKDAMKKNLREKIEALNGVKFSEGEWSRFYEKEIKGIGGVKEKSKAYHTDNIRQLVRDDGTSKNIKLLDSDNWYNNQFEVTNQYRSEGKDNGGKNNRFDLTILVNGLPVVHIELKRRGVNIKEAFNQINRYIKESFWDEDGLFDYAQIFVISNGTETRYYSNTTRETVVKEGDKTADAKKSRTSNSYEFTIHWADRKNKNIWALEDFASNFLNKRALHAMLSKYCIYTAEEKLIVMRPYQIVATESILNRIKIAHENKKYGSKAAGGYIWHTTGSGKTLTSFKAAQLACKLGYIKKVFFVVDRKDLDYQTMREYDRFEPGAANGNNDTKELEKQIQDDRKKIIVTTIQKLSYLMKSSESGKNGKKYAIFDEEVVLIFDECHRSQFGKMHLMITKNFKKYYIFGFTGTPIFPDNANKTVGLTQTTKDVFGDELHKYTIVDAIRDEKVLKFRVEYVSTVKNKEIEDREKSAFAEDNEGVLMCNERIEKVSKYILDNFGKQTKRNEVYSFNRVTNIDAIVSAKKKRVEAVREKTSLGGFNSILAVSCIDAAKLYYTELKRLNEEKPEEERLKIATIFSYGQTETARTNGEMDEEDSHSTENLDAVNKEFLEDAIRKYNHDFNTNYDTSTEKFENYYKDVSHRMKNREIDILIVVNMFLTGFDATTLNTLWVDKNLRYHGLIQAFSRTNRILNSVKSFGNIVCFRDLEKDTNEALKVFGADDKNGKISLLRSFKDYMDGYIDEFGVPVMGYRDMVRGLEESFPRTMVQTEDGVEERIQYVRPDTEEEMAKYVENFNEILKTRNILGCYDKFGTDECPDPLSDRVFDNCKSVYLNIRDYFKKNTGRGGGDPVELGDIVFEMDLIKSVEINIDYIVGFISSLKETNDEKEKKRIREYIMRKVESSSEVRDKADLVEMFMEKIEKEETDDSQVVEDMWMDFVNERKIAEYEEIVKKYEMKRDEAMEYMKKAFVKRSISQNGREFSALIPKINPFKYGVKCSEMRSEVFDVLKAFYEKYSGIASSEF